jgi:hypothetical protein
LSVSPLSRMYLRRVSLSGTPLVGRGPVFEAGLAVALGAAAFGIGSPWGRGF